MSTEAVKDLRLEAGALAVAVIKATDVVVETPAKAGSVRRGPDDL
jgi:molybdopterin-binding protein